MSNSLHERELDRYATALGDLREACREHVALLKRLGRPGRGGVPKGEIRRAATHLEEALRQSTRGFEEEG